MNKTIFAIMIFATCTPKLTKRRSKASSGYRQAVCDGSMKTIVSGI
ncbi:MAG: hypothetical protein Q8Q60_02175 [Candidatus Chromulinivorax sp.]|nr:hypothetical protein [Candidatus Chromulinivorax sp.]